MNTNKAWMMANLFLVFLVTTLCGCTQKWQQIFNEKDFTGWHKLPGGTWQIEDGILIGKNEKSDERHGLLLSDKKYKDFIAEFQFKVVKGNSGFYFRSEKVDHVVGVKGFQAEIDEKEFVGGLYETLGREYVVKPTAAQVQAWFKPYEWNKMTVEAHGGSITVKVNDKISAELKNDKGLSSGHFGLQLHGSQDMEVHFRKMKVKDL